MMIIIMMISVSLGVKVVLGLLKDFLMYCSRYARELALSRAFFLGSMLVYNKGKLNVKDAIEFRNSTSWIKLADSRRVRLDASMIDERCSSTGERICTQQ